MTPVANNKVEDNQGEAKAVAAAGYAGAKAELVEAATKRPVQVVAQPVGAMRAHAACHQM